MERDTIKYDIQATFFLKRFDTDSCNFIKVVTVQSQVQVQDHIFIDSGAIGFGLDSDSADTFCGL